MKYKPLILTKAQLVAVVPWLCLGAVSSWSTVIAHKYGSELADTIAGYTALPFVLYTFGALLWIAVAAILHVVGPYLNGWHRIGGVDSVLWMIGAMVYGASWPDYASSLREACVSRALKNPVAGQVEGCFEEWRLQHPTAVSTQRWNTFGDTTVPVLLAWLFTYIVLGVYRWIRRGFPQHVKQ